MTGPPGLESLVPDLSDVRTSPALQLCQKSELPTKEETLFTVEEVPAMLGRFRDTGERG